MNVGKRAPCRETKALAQDPIDERACRFQIAEDRVARIAGEDGPGSGRRLENKGPTITVSAVSSISSHSSDGASTLR
jgi:hypothetical protein